MASNNAHKIVPFDDQAMSVLAKLSLYNLFTFFLGAGLVEAQFEPYLYTIYYNEDDCNATIANTVSLIGHSSEDDEYTVGGLDNVTHLCSIESACLINNRTELCNNLIRTSESAVSNSISNKGRVFQCDGTNSVIDQGECRFLDQCYKSSAYPNCNFRLVTTSDIFENLNLIRNENAYDDDGLDLQSYMLLYSDESCSEFEGTHGLVAGTTPLKPTSESMPCSDAVACAFLPEGLRCTANGGTTGEIINIHTKPAVNNVAICGNETAEASCEEIDPDVCMKSEVYPSCWVRMATAKVLFSDPERFLMSTTFPLVAQEEPLEVDNPSALEDDNVADAAAFPCILVGLTLVHFAYSMLRM